MCTYALRQPVFVTENITIKKTCRYVLEEDEEEEEVELCEFHNRAAI